MGIPEHSGPAELYYDEEESLKYTQNSRIVYIQRLLALRCLELLEAKDGGLLLDVGCGSGLSGSVLTENGYPWVGIDISMEMLKLGMEREEGVGYIRMDMGKGLDFQPGTFDGVVSVSAIQWLFHSYSSEDHPVRRIRTFFTTLYSVCKPDAKCVLQFYLKSQNQIEMLKSEAIRAGFSGGIQIDNEGTRNVKSFLVLTSNREARCRKERKKKGIGRIDAILRRKEKLKLKGVEVPRNTRYTGKKRSRR
ncbi:putative methyltransferase [Encephalitozoon intestinalis ATCC 50506]|uniref:Methyltransferase n=1 Tax=Encephalitozoon intestinalis (strain ATCC 50506) TaxID=876142 RepID=E0S7B8_ENCIT|nr:putative methyltransferase [Encephalitozoon intestinalis ATCC 50506]ADM11546.1 putative methyltransferase [Encephalitozoon intestinalis ATCC 50506]UTX45260.1 putative rRNA (guanine-N(7))-methyltransferase [Encephalitozoon intestinalis]